MSMPPSPDRTSVLFVCMGNICRSPLAECVFRHKAMERGVDHLFEIDSAGTGGWHAGDPPDERMRAVAERRGITLDGAARQIESADFARFDHILCADEHNLADLLALGAPASKTRLLLTEDPAAKVLEVPDPYYGGIQGFDVVFDLVDSACLTLLETLLRERGQRPDG